MWRYRLKVILLSLGVVFGYGSALAHGRCGHHGTATAWARTNKPHTAECSTHCGMDRVHDWMHGQTHDQTHDKAHSKTNP